MDEYRPTALPPAPGGAALTYGALLNRTNEIVRELRDFGIASDRAGGCRRTGRCGGHTWLPLARFVCRFTALPQKNGALFRRSAGGGL
jgi:hypothetical protein